jgi:hypothetical protein
MKNRFVRSTKKAKEQALKDISEDENMCHPLFYMEKQILTFSNISATY